MHTGLSTDHSPACRPRHAPHLLTSSMPQMLYQRICEFVLLFLLARPLTAPPLVARARSNISTAVLPMAEQFGWDKVRPRGCSRVC